MSICAAIDAKITSHVKSSAIVTAHTVQRRYVTKEIMNILPFSTYLDTVVVFLSANKMIIHVQRTYISLLCSIIQQDT
jgi:hypothetical protein